MASMSETLTSKHGGIPTYAILLGGVGVLVLIMFMRSKNGSKNTPQALQTNVLSPGGATSLTQGAAPMSYMGGNIYNNIALAPTSTATATANSPAPPPPPAGPPPPPVTPPKPIKSPPPAAKPTYGEYVIPAGSGQSYSYVANKFHVPGGANALFALNTSPTGPHSPTAASKLKAQGKNLLYGGQIVYYPKS